VQPRNDGLLVRGVLRSTGELVALNALLHTQGLEQRIYNQVTTDEAVAGLVRESSPGLGVQVRREGERQFVVAGVVADVAHASNVLARLRTDLELVGIGLRIEVTDRNDEVSGTSGLLTDRDGTSFARGRDGARHIVHTPPATKPAGTPVNPPHREMTP
jgi:hypothetical protein